ncbi:MAG: adenylyl-sulfate kinase [Bacteroidetes bacterium]|jgi:adenylylsulfate kinase|nr:adenylyl-sulfate kinase [Bacteroidota bacterium]
MNHIHPIFDKLVQRTEREKMLGQRGTVVWMTGLSGSGKSTIAIGLQHKLHRDGHLAYVLDGDNIRAGINKNLGFSETDREENIRRIAEVAKLMADVGIIVICCFVSPTRKIRSAAATIIGHDDFREVYINTPLEVCEERDVKGLYAKARAGEIADFTGITAPFEEPARPDLEIKTQSLSINDSVELLYSFIKERITDQKL